MTEDKKNEKLKDFLAKLIQIEKAKAEEAIAGKRAASNPSVPKPVGLFEHLADSVVNWLLRKFFPSKTVMPKAQVEELKDLRVESLSLRKDVGAYRKITTNLQTLMNQGDYTRSFESLKQLSGRTWTRMTPEAYRRLIDTPDIWVCDHKKGFRWRQNTRRSFTKDDYNIWDHTFVDGRREVRCLNHCGWKSEPGDSNWPIALIMLKSTTNESTASERFVKKDEAK